MDITLDATARDWRDRAFRFATEELIPYEVEAELNEGRLPPEVEKRHKKLAIELGFSAMDVPKSQGGLQLASSTRSPSGNSSAASPTRSAGASPRPQSWMFEACTAGPGRAATSCRSCAASARSATRSPRAARAADVAIETTARRAKGGYAITGEKWYVTSANLADYFILQARLADGPHAGADALFFIDKETPGIEVLRSPALQPHLQRPPPDLPLPATSWCRRRTGSGPRATACASRTPGSAASG